MTWQVVHERKKQCSRTFSSEATPSQTRHSGSTRHLYQGRWQNATARGLHHWHFHLLLFWLALSLLCNGTYVTMNQKFSWELVDCCVTYVTEQLWCQLVLCILGSFILARVTEQHFCSFEVILERDLSMQIDFFKKHSIWYELLYI